ncbi:ABC transporter permease [Saccharopolyspora erythraea]|uniref:ABC transporter permease n=1 Tax=Saccharopolyspora erythraea TaxID=1836 RepID=UPI001BAC8DCC|nr:ABC transporter permease [Saccharopolyspora erythraea]QUG99997.1 ABC transporter permease [Saccharopolyspora erythraea]
MSAVWLVARREVVTRVRTRSFVVGTLVTIAILGLYVAVTMFVGANQTTKVGVAGQATAVAEQLRVVSDERGRAVEVLDVDDESAGLERLRDGELDALVTGAPDALRLVVEQQADPELAGALDTIAKQQALDAELAKSGLDPAAVRSTMDSAQVLVTSLEQPDPQRGERLGVAVAAGLMLYMFLIMAGQTVAQGVVEEKSSRVVEILLSTIRPGQLLTGKVIGIGLVGLLQFGIISGTGLAAAAGAGAVTLPSGALAGSLALTLAWFVLGYFFFATILAAAASLVSRQEELQSVVSPVSVLLVLPFVVAVSVLPGDPDSTTGAVLSLVPGFSPVLMPMRAALGVAAPWELVVSVVLTLVTTAALLRLGGRVYAGAVLRTGARVRLGDALRRS